MYTAFPGVPPWPASSSSTSKARRGTKPKKSTSTEINLSQHVLVSLLQQRFVIHSSPKSNFCNFFFFFFLSYFCDLNNFSHSTLYSFTLMARNAAVIRSSTRLVLHFISLLQNSRRQINTQINYLILYTQF